jgi:hypothetical protein
MRSIRDSPIGLLRHSPNTTLAFWGRLASVVLPIASVGTVVLLALASLLRSGLFSEPLLWGGCLALNAIAAFIMFAAGRAAARMSNEERVGALPEALLAMGRTSKTYWAGVAIFGAILAAASIALIVVIVVVDF